MKILLSTVVALLLLGCSEGGTDSVKETVNEKASKVVEQSEAVAKDAKEIASESSAVVEKTVTQTTEQVESKAKEILEESTAVAEKVAKDVEVKSTEVVKEATATINEKRTEIAKAIEPKETSKVESTVDGAAVYKSCVACHGANAEKKALNKSQIIKGWESSQTIAALNGYKDGSYGGAMKGIMKAQVSKLSDAEIEAVAKHISGL